MHAFNVRTYAGVCDTEYAHNTALKIGTALVNYYVPLAVMAVLYSRIFVAIRRRSKLEIWQNAVVVAGGGRTTWSDDNNAATSRKLLASRHDDEDGEESDAEAVSRGGDDGQPVVRGGDDGQPVVHLVDDERASPRQSTVVVDHIRSQNSPDREARSTRLHADEVESAPPPPPPVDARRKRVRFLLVRQRQSDSNDADDLDQIEMWSDRPNDCDTTSGGRSGGGGRLPARLMRRLRHGMPKGRPRGGDRQKQSSLSSDVKAAKQLGVIMGAFCVCFLPYFVCFVVVAVCRQCVDDQLMTAVTWIGYVNSTLNPFLYPLCNQQFRISFRRMFASVLNLGSATRGTAALAVTGN